MMEGAGHSSPDALAAIVHAAQAVIALHYYNSGYRLRPTDWLAGCSRTGRRDAAAAWQPLRPTGRWVPPPAGARIPCPGTIQTLACPCTCALQQWRGTASSPPTFTPTHSA